MRRLNYLRSALIGGASVLAMVQPSSAKQFNVPGGDLSDALGAYMQQSGAQIFYVDDAVRGHRSAGAKGDYTQLAALDRVLSGTGFKAETMPSSAIAIISDVPTPKKPEIRLAANTARPSVAAAPEVVTVTAQRVREDIQNVPIAVSAFSQKQLTERQIATGGDLIRETPNMNFSKTNFTGYNIELRGIGTQAISVTTDPAVAVAFNGVPFLRNHFFEQEFYDLSSVEVLRGPQGTLYGRNATAGVVNIIPAKPSDSYEAMLSVDFGNYNNRRFEGMVNIPIVGDKLDIRVAGEWTKRDGYSFNTILNSPIDGRDLWSSRITVGWKPTEELEADLVWEHFSEDDNRMRTAKQLCETAPIPTNIDGVNPLTFGPPGDYGAPGDYLSQGCQMTSLYAKSAFEVPNGYSLTYYAPLNAAGVPVREFFDVYASTIQSTNLRDIESTINPTYRAKNDTLELNVDDRLTQTLTLTSQTGYNNDYLFSTEDYNRFNSAPGAFLAGGINGRTLPDPAAGKNGVPADSGVFCDPQLGCSDRLVLQDLSDERSWQFSQEFRLASSLNGPFNFSVGGNYLHYSTDEDYYVFINTLTLFELTANYEGYPYVPGVSDNHQCIMGGQKAVNPLIVKTLFEGCGYIDPNPISSLNGQGHNYFRSQNPYSLNSYALFGEVYYNVTDDLKLTGGVRWTEDQKQFVDIPSELLIPGYGYPVAGIVNQQWDRFTGRGVIDWTPKLDFTDQTLVYASIAHGYKAGGANPPGAYYPSTVQGGGTGLVTNPIHPLTFKPEYIDALELGTKNTLLDGALTINGDVFYYAYRDYQISEIVDRTAINNNYNAHVEGAELESNWEPSPGLKFSFAGGYENATLDKKDQGVDLMDRTAGNPNWIVVRPYVTTASNCIFPTYVVAAAVSSGSPGPFYNMCNLAYGAHVDPITELPYVPNPTVGLDFVPPNYPGYDPTTAPNNGEGFSKNLGGNQLPNAPHFTASFTAEYTMPVWQDWAATLHGDFYWQSQSWARVFNDNPYDQLHGYTNLNLSLILNSADGWQAMLYVKNVLNTTAITGDFLNSDDSGLTTNVFLTDPRLFGIRVTKHLDESNGPWGGSDLITSLFSDTDNAKPTLWIELGGQLAELNATSTPFAPAFVSSYGANGVESPLPAERAPHFDFEKEAKISYQADDSPWVLSAAIRFGRASSSRNQHQQTPNQLVQVLPFTLFGFAVGGNAYYPTGHVKFADASGRQTEDHTIIDFLAGKDLGLGMFGLEGSSVVSAGVRIAQFNSKSSITLNAEPDVQYPGGPLADRAAKYVWDNSKIHFHDYAASATLSRNFYGVGPELAWDASTSVTGNENDGEITFDWGLNASVLYGRQKANGHHQTTAKSYYLSHWAGNDSRGGKIVPGHFSNNAFQSSREVFDSGKTAQHTYAAAHNRSRMVSVPNLGAFAGLSVKYHNARISFGYRADEFLDVLDGGMDSHKAYTRGFDGPFAKISLGLGG